MQEVEDSGAVQLLEDTMQPILEYLQRVKPDKDGRVIIETVAVIGGITHAFVDLLIEATNDIKMAKKMMDYVMGAAFDENRNHGKWIK